MRLDKKLFQLINTGLLISLASLCLGAEIAAERSAIKKLEIDDLAIDFTLKSLDKENIRLNELRGNIVLINFWASWSSSSRRLLPQFETLYKSYQDKGFMVLSINIDPDKSQAIFDKTELSYPILLDDRKSVSASYNIDLIPSFFLIDRNGEIKLILENYDPTFYEIIETKLKDLLKDPSEEPTT